MLSEIECAVFMIPDRKFWSLSPFLPFVCVCVCACRLCIARRVIAVSCATDVLRNIMRYILRSIHTILCVCLFVLNSVVIYSFMVHFGLCFAFASAFYIFCHVHTILQTAFTVKKWLSFTFGKENHKLHRRCDVVPFHFVRFVSY